MNSKSKSNKDPESQFYPIIHMGFTMKPNEHFSTLGLAIFVDSSVHPEMEYIPPLLDSVWKLP